MSYRFDDPTPYKYQPGALFLGRDGDNNEIGFLTERHAITIGGSGAGKGAALLVPNCRLYPESLICIDTKGENATLSWEWREAHGQDVAILDPFGETDPARVPRRLIKSFNPLQGIDPASPRAVAEIKAIANGLVVVHDKKHMEWTEGARTMLAGLMAYIIESQGESRRHFGTLRDMLTQPNETNEDGVGLYPDAQRMAQHAGGNSLARLIRAAGNAMMTGIEAEKGMEKDFLGLAKRATQWLDDDAIQASLSHSTFDLHDLANGKTSVFLVLPADYIRDYSAFLRMFIKAALHVMGGNKSRNRCLFLLDEFYSLGKMEELAESSGRMRSYGVSLWPFLQNLSQLNALYGQEEADTFFANADVHCFLGNDQDVRALRYISERIGPLTRDEVRAAPPDLSFAQKKEDYRYWKQRLGEDDNSYWKRIEAEEENKRRVSDWQNSALRADYEHAMRQVGTPRLTPDEIAGLVGKSETDIVARSMIVFLPRHKVVQLKLAPYFAKTSDPAPAEFEERPTKKPRPEPLPAPAPVYYRAPPKDRTLWGVLALAICLSIISYDTLTKRPLDFGLGVVFWAFAAATIGVFLLRHRLKLSTWAPVTIAIAITGLFLMVHIAPYGAVFDGTPRTSMEMVISVVSRSGMVIAVPVTIISAWYCLIMLIARVKAALA